MRLLFLVSVLSASSAFAFVLPGEQVSKLSLRAEGPSGTGEVQPVPERLNIVAPAVVSSIGGAGALVGGFLLLFGAIGGNIGFLFVGIATCIVAALPILVGVPWLIVAAVKNAALDREQQRSTAALVTLATF